MINSANDASFQTRLLWKEHRSNTIQIKAADGGISSTNLFGVLIIDSHKDLVNAWKAIRKCKDPVKRDAAIAVLTKMPITEAEAMQMVTADWKDPSIRNQKIKEWGQFAKEKFKEARDLAK